jgi:hypothetical protein
MTILEDRIFWPGGSSALIPAIVIEVNPMPIVRVAIAFRIEAFYCKT